MSRTKEDVVQAAGRLFAERGYEGTSMRDLGRELGLLGSSLYSHVGSKQDLLVEIVNRGAELFEASVARALATDGPAVQRLQALIAGHIEVVLDNLDVARTFLNEATALDARHRRQVIQARDRYEAAFRTVLRDGRLDGSFDAGIDPKLDAIFVLSILNAIERWYRTGGSVSRAQLVDRVHRFVGSGLREAARQT